MPAGLWVRLMGVLLDLRLPGINGRAVHEPLDLEELHQSHLHRRIQ